jgi:citrate synthase
MGEIDGRRPNVDFALVAMRRALGLPQGAALSIFVVGRSVGWIAHALEQQQEGKLIRPRARYVGPAPGEADD